MKTRQPLILTARIAEPDLEPFDRLRQTHFPPARNFLRAHLTMFHRLPGEYADRIVAQLQEIAGRTAGMTAEVDGIRHLGAGVAVSIESPQLEDVRSALKAGFGSWLGPQDEQRWQPHVTVQNKVSKEKADALFRHLNETFRPHPIEIIGLDLWEYLGGPWQHMAFVPFGDDRQTGP